jgi:hypothetical protein
MSPSEFTPKQLPPARQRSGTQRSWISLPEPNRELLDLAWKRQHIYSVNAVHARQRFSGLRVILASLNVLVVVLAVIQPQLNATTNACPGISFLFQAAIAQPLASALAALPIFGLDQSPGFICGVNFLLVLLPITVTGLLAFSVKFDRGNNWVLLRGNAEALKMSIFYYRTGVRPYTAENRDALLAQRLKSISERLKSSPVHHAAFHPYEQQPPQAVQRGIVVQAISSLSDRCTRSLQAVWNWLFRYEPTPLAREADPLTNLSPDTYLQVRLDHQFNWYRSKAQRYDVRLQYFQAGIYFFGGLGTLLAAIGWQVWVAVTTALVAALANLLEYKRIEASLVGYNQAADALYDIRAWWSSLSPKERQNPEKWALLVNSTESTIHSENASWLQDMQDRLADLYGQADAEENSNSDTSEADEPVSGAEIIGP